VGGSGPGFCQAPDAQEDFGIVGRPEEKVIRMGQLLVRQPIERTMLLGQDGQNARAVAVLRIVDGIGQRRVVGAAVADEYYGRAVPLGLALKGAGDLRCGHEPAGLGQGKDEMLAYRRNRMHDDDVFSHGEALLLR
jgi:hypothetical protein